MFVTGPTINIHARVAMVVAIHKGVVPVTWFVIIMGLVVNMIVVVQVVTVLAISILDIALLAMVVIQKGAPVVTI